MNRNFKPFNDYWNKQNSGRTSDVFSYYNEYKDLLFFLDAECKYDCLELGCGNGDLFKHAQKNYNSYTGVDFSKKNIEFFQAKFPNANLVHDNVLNFETEKKFSLIHSNHLFQYLTEKQIKELLKNNLKQCNENGVIVHRGILDKRLQSLFFKDYLKPGINHLNYKKIFYPILYKIFYNYKLITVGGEAKMGFWHDVSDILNICSELNINARIFGSNLYRYRYSLVIYKS